MFGIGIGELLVMLLVIALLVVGGVIAIRLGRR